MVKEKNIEELDDLIGPIMVDPSILISKRYLSNLLEFNRELYVPNSFIKMLRAATFEEKGSPDYNFYSGYLSPELLADVEFIESHFKALRISTFSRKDAERIPPKIEPVITNVEKLYLPPYVREILKEEIAFLFTHSGLISRLKKPLEMMGKAKLPIIDITRSVPEDWEYAVKGMKIFCNWMAFVVDLSMTANLLHASIVTLGISGIRMIIIDP